MKRQSEAIEPTIAESLRVNRRADGGQIEPLKIVCGWCEGPVGLSGECERACDRGRQRRLG
jgi:hypothetical protein